MLVDDDEKDDELAMEATDDPKASPGEDMFNYADIVVSDRACIDVYSQATLVIQLLALHHCHPCSSASPLTAWPWESQVTPRQVQRKKCALHLPMQQWRSHIGVVTWIGYVN